jgi:hypothetical protein
MYFFLFIIFLNLFVVVPRVPCTSYLVMRISAKAGKNLGIKLLCYFEQVSTVIKRKWVKMKRLRVKFTRTSVDFLITHAKVWFKLTRVRFPLTERDFNTHKCVISTRTTVIKTCTSVILTYCACDLKTKITSYEICMARRRFIATVILIWFMYAIDFHIRNWIFYDQNNNN